MKEFKKYLLLAFLLENIMAQTKIMSWLSGYLFYPFMACGLFGLLISLNPVNLKKFGSLYALIGVYIVYEFCIGVEYINPKTITYLIAKISTFGIIIVSLSSAPSFYKKKGLFILVCFMAFFLFYGLMIGGDIRGHGRALAGYTNENTAGSMGALTVGILLFYTRNHKWTPFKVFLLFIGFYGVLAGGSRAGFLMLAMLIFLRYGINVKTIFVGALLLFTGLYVLPTIGVQTIGLQRMVDTYEGIEGNNREVEREAAEWMIAQKPWTGWGFQAENQGYAARLTEILSHNGYLETIKQMGYPTAFFYFLIIIYTTLNYWRLQYRAKIKMSLFLALVLVLYVKANYEAAFVGVHEYLTNIFFVSLAMINTQSYYIKRNLRKK